MSLCLSVYLVVCVCLSVCLPDCLSACVSVCLPVVSLWIQVSKQIPYFRIVIVYKHPRHILYYCRFNRRMCFELCSADEIRTQIPGGCVDVVWLDRGRGGGGVAQRGGWTNVLPGVVWQS